MKKIFAWIVVLLIAIFFIQSCVKENIRAHNEFVATVDYLKPEPIREHFSGNTVVKQYIPSSDDYTGQSEERRYWSYNLMMNPVSEHEAVTGYCAPHHTRPGCDWAFFVMTAYIEKDGTQYVSSVAWQSGTGFNPRDWLTSGGYTVTRCQYFIAYQTNFQNDPETNFILEDISSTVRSWAYAVNEREGRTVLIFE